MTEPPSAVLRPARASDAEFLRELYFDTRRDEFAGLSLPAGELGRLLQLQHAAQSRQYAGQFPGAEQHIVQIGGAPAGRLYLDRAADEIRIVDVCLVRLHRGQGVGTELLRALQAEAAGRAVPLRLSVRRDNPAARLYARLGFIERGADDVYRHLEWRAPAPQALKTAS